MRGAALSVVVLAAACQNSSPPPSKAVGGPGITIAVAPPNNKDGEWLLPGRDYANSRYSNLAQITPANAKELHVAWTFSTGVLRGHEGQPLVVDNTMYIVTPYPNVAYALDLTQPGFPAKWKYRPENAQAAVGEACCDVVNRGASYANGKIVYNLLDGHTVAVDAATGTELWRVKMGDLNHGETITMAPIVVKNKVIVGSSGGEMGVRGWIAALDLETGKQIWRAYNIGPDADIKAGARFKPYYKQDQIANSGTASWPGDSWKVGGATVWGWVSYDPALNLIYHGTSNPGPWNGNQRPGDNKWSAAIIARDADTGDMVWAFQPTPHDIWDFDAVNENILVDMPMSGTTRKVLVHFDRNGFAYTIDRATGQVLVAQPFVPMNWSSGVDLATGRPNVNVDKATAQGKHVKDICPSLEGGKNQQPAAFSPKTGLFYVPTNNLCMDFTGREVTYIAGTPYIGGDAPEVGGPGGYKGEFIAWDAAQGKKLWGIKEPFPVWSGALATAGNVVYYGTLDGWFKAVDAHSGKLLWQFKTGSGIIGQPTTYKGPDGKQYVAILSGVGGWAGAIVAGGLDARDESAALGFAGVMKDLPKYTNKGGMLYVFALP